ncbi:MAG TPA: hypothetical protein VM677_27885 [Actinokineospora sp.]|nr:hypothetical protein [Actinokineospora sp.]
MRREVGRLVLTVGGPRDRYLFRIDPMHEFRVPVPNPVPAFDVAGNQLAPFRVARYLDTGTFVHDPWLGHLRVYTYGGTVH